MSNEQALREALQAYQEANEMSPYGDYSKIEWESSAGPVNPSWGGGDCKKHGRWYGRCYSCSDEWDNLRKRSDRDAYSARENALNAAKQLARQALALPTAEQVDDINVAESFTSVTKTAAPEMPLSMNQFGRLVELAREHQTDNTFVYKATSTTGDTCHFGVESAAKAWAKSGTVEAIKVREFKLHTSCQTSYQTDERAAFEREMGCEEIWGHRSFKKKKDGRYENWCVDLMWDVWQARAALPTQQSAVDGLPTLPEPDLKAGMYGYRVSHHDYFTAEKTTAYATAAVQQYKEDAERYRWLCEQNASLEIDRFVVITQDCANGEIEHHWTGCDLDAAIDAAMRKGKA